MALDIDPLCGREPALRQEARYLHAALFGSAAPESLVEEYLDAHRHYCAPGPESINLDLIVSRKLDVEALELALRGRRPELTRKFRILLYLTEVKPEYYPRLVNRANTPLRAWAALVAAGGRTVYKTLKGRLLLRRHPLV